MTLCTPDGRDAIAAEVRATRAAWGRRLRELRREQGWTQEDLAVRSGVSAPAISLIENGRSGGDPRSHFALAHAFGLRPGDVFCLPRSDSG